MGTPRQPSLFFQIRQVLVSHRSHCLNCGASIDARNAQAWATLHVKRNPGHVVETVLGYRVAEEANDA